MKNIKTYIGAGLIGLTLVSCQDAGQMDEMKKQDKEKVMGAVDAKVMELSVQMDIRCGAKLDSLAEMALQGSSKSSGTSGTTTTGKTETTKTVKKDDPANKAKKDKMSGEPTEVTKEQTQEKKDKMSGETKTVTEDDTKKKKDKMKGPQ